MWQDWYFAAAGLLYSAVLIPSLRDPKTEIPRRSSVLTTATLTSCMVVYATLGMWWAAVSTGIGAVVWGFLAWCRFIRKVDGMQMVLTDEREMEMVEKYRVFQAHQQAVYDSHTDGGCGTCPSQGGCSETEA